MAEHEILGKFWLVADGEPTWIFTENETNTHRLFGVGNHTPYVKDAFHEYLIGGRISAINPARVGTKAAAQYRLDIAGGGIATIRLRLTNQALGRRPFGKGFEAVMEQRRKEADEFYGERLPAGLTPDERAVARQAYAGLLWNKQFYHYIVRDWLDGDPSQPPPPPSRRRGRNSDWGHLYNRDIISMPDKWEYPWYAAWDLAFHMIPFSRIDPEFAKQQLVLFLREWYMHPNGELPAYEFALGDVNPPVHAWACWRVYKIAAARGQRDRLFLSRCFQKLILNFTWWVNRKDATGRHLFSGGFLGLDNIGVFNRSESLPTGDRMEQADGTAWMAFYCTTMMAIAMQLAQDNPATEDMASKFFEHFVAITDAINTLGGTGLWDEADGFYYDQLHVKEQRLPLKVRSLVGLVPLLAVAVLEDAEIQRLPGFYKRLNWFLEHRPDLNQHISYCSLREVRPGQRRRLLAVPSRDRLIRVLRYVLDENEFLSPFGIRSLSKYHAEHRTCFGSMARSTASLTIRRSQRPVCSAATPTGGVRSGFR